MEPHDAPTGPLPDTSGDTEAFGLAQPGTPLWANRHLRLGLLLACLLGALLALLDARAAWFGLGEGSARAGGVTFPAGCPGGEAPQVRSVATGDLSALREKLARIIPARVGRLYEAGPVATSNLWTDEEPPRSPVSGATAPAAYELRWWALDRDGSRDDVVADALEFATSEEADHALALAASPRCRRDAAARAIQSPSGARELSWTNPDNAREVDVLFVRGRRLYRTIDAPPGYLLDQTGPRQGALERARAGMTVELLACALPDAGCPTSTISLQDTSLAALPARPLTGAPATPAQAAAYAHAVNLRGYDVPGMKPQAREGPLQDGGSWSAFAVCTGGLRSTRALAIHSPVFADGNRRDAQFVYSTVAVLPSSALASQFIETVEGARARACIERDDDRLLRAGLAARRLRAAASITLTRLPTATPRSYRGLGRYRAVRLLAQVTYVTRRGARRQLPPYVEGFVFACGPAVVELTSVTYARRFPEANERFLEAVLVGAAEANEASL